MINILNIICKPLPTDAQSESECRRGALVEEIKSIRRRMNSTRLCFENECDEDMIEACIYELEALGARHRYLTKQLCSCDLDKNGSN